LSTRRETNRLGLSLGLGLGINLDLDDVLSYLVSCLVLCCLVLSCLVFVLCLPCLFFQSKVRKNGRIRKAYLGKVLVDIHFGNFGRRRAKGLPVQDQGEG
jgi:hypothetical protein